VSDGLEVLSDLSDDTFESDTGSNHLFVTSSLISIRPYKAGYTQYST